MLQPVEKVNFTITAQSLTNLIEGFWSERNEEKLFDLASTLIPEGASSVIINQQVVGVAIGVKKIVPGPDNSFLFVDNTKDKELIKDLWHFTEMIEERGLDYYMSVKKGVLTKGQTGLLAPNGDFWPCDYCAHELTKEFLRYRLNLPKLTGWIHVSRGELQLEFVRKLTRKQRDLIYDVYEDKINVHSNKVITYAQLEEQVDGY